MSKQSPVLNEKQLKRVLNSTKMTKFGDRNRLVMVLSYYAGLRACEICSLTVSDVIDGEGEVKEQVLLKSHQTKEAKGNTIYLSDYVRKEIAKYVSSNDHLKQRPAERLIQSQKGGGLSSQTNQNSAKLTTDVSPRLFRNYAASFFALWTVLIETRHSSAVLLIE